MSFSENSYNFINCNVKEFKDFVRFVWESNQEHKDMKAVLGLGKPGIGKTQSMHQLAKELGIGYKEARVAFIPPEEIMGLPVIKDGKSTWTRPDFLPDEEVDGKYGLFVLDEITSADKHKQTMIMELLETNRRIGPHRLPDGWMVVLLGNGPEDGGYFAGSTRTLTGRVYGVNVTFDLNVWRKWALENGVNSSVIAFLTAMPEYIHKMNIEEPIEMYPSPRTWEALSRLLNTYEKIHGNKDMDEDMIRRFASGSVGLEAGEAFLGYYKWSSQIVPVTSILKGEGKSDLKKLSKEALYITANSLVKELYNIIKKNTINSSGVSEYKDIVYEVCGNACSWVVAVGRQNLDIATMILNDLNDFIPNFHDVVLDERFDSICPDLAQFAVENKIVFG